MTARVIEASDREIVLSRTFDAPRERVWEAWTDVEQVAQWWGPRGFTTTTQEMDARVGGTWQFMMHGPDGTDYPNVIKYSKVVRPERLEYHHGSGDPNYAGFEVVVTFEDVGRKTELTMRSLFPTAEARAFVVEKFGAIEGGNQTLERLGEYLSSL
jgi:uncharacterized protein YndB with AHSA1/START domain